ncbi:sporulation histidine kinase inhibitor Sda [Thalassobacillus sp. CUG 92003]|uniref:sporulation histidine kinase inhibitor Sda n=1 Tax=Thalassobacillus sp. CUG 92003 TaxID=2736641 RepID=UPI00351A6D12
MTKGCLAVRYLSNDMLKLTYHLALKSNVDLEFIDLLKQELQQRKLQIKPKQPVK